MRYRYFAYGLRIESAIALPELGSQFAFAEAPDLTIRLGNVSHPESQDRLGRNLAHWIDARHFWFRSELGAHFAVRDGCEITVMLDPGTDASAMRLYLLGSVCGALLQQRGLLALHGNAIKIGEGCLVCVGASGIGKSTLAAAFFKRGFEILADDVVAIDAAGRAAPSFPRMKLWQDAAHQLGLSTDGISPIMPGMNKFNFPIPAAGVGEFPRVRWIYELNVSDGVEDIEIEQIDGMRRAVHLIEHTYRNEYLRGEILDPHLQQCSQLAARIRLCKVTRPIGGFTADRLADRLLEHIAHGADADGAGETKSVGPVDEADQTRRHHSI